MPASNGSHHNQLRWRISLSNGEVHDMDGKFDEVWKKAEEYWSNCDATAVTVRLTHNGLGQELGDTANFDQTHVGLPIWDGQ